MKWVRMSQVRELGRDKGAYQLTALKQVSKPAI